MLQQYVSGHYREYAKADDTQRTARWRYKILKNLLSSAPCILPSTFTGYTAAVASSLLVPLILAQIEPTVLGVIRRALFSLSAQFKYAVQIGNCSGTFPSHSHLPPFTPVQQLEYLTAGILTAFVSLFSVYLWCFAAKSLFIAVR